MEADLLEYRLGVLGIPPSCKPCNVRSCLINQFKNNDSINQFLSFIQLEKGETLFHQAKPIDGIYIICRGIVERSYRTITGKVQAIQFIQTGDWLMEEVLGQQKNHSTFAKVLTRTLVAFIHRKDFEKLIKEYPALGEILLERVGQQIIQLWKRLTLRAYASPQEQLAFTFTSLGELFSENNGNEKILKLPLTEARLADYSGICRRSVIRYLKRLENLELVSYKRRDTKILDMDGLRQIVDSA